MRWVVIMVCALAVALEIAIHWPNPHSFADRFAPALSMPASEDLSLPAKPKGNKSIQMRVV